jgi:hypothetical protein
MFFFPDDYIRNIYIKKQEEEKIVNGSSNNNYINDRLLE